MIAFRYLVHLFAIRTAFVGAALLALYVIGEVFDKLRYVGPAFPVNLLLEYIATKAPSVLAAFMPLVVLLGLAFAWTELALHRETVAFRAAGFPLRRMLAPSLVVAAAAGLIGFAIDEWGTPAAIRADTLERVYIKHMRPSATNAEWIKDERRLMRLVPLGGGRWQLVVLEYDDAHRWMRRIDAAVASYRAGIWHMEDVRILAPGPSGATETRLDRFELASQASPQLTEPPPPRFMRLAELRRYIRALARAGTDTAGYRYAFWQKLFRPLGCIAMALVAAALCLHLAPRAASTALAVFAVLLFGLGLLVLEQIAGFFVAGGRLAPFYGAILPPWFFASAGLALLLQREGY
ncbi:MAG: LptF/LptG family permease [Zetaproteobacteria bacterium]|nr:MAG: LptF/LptG family permease [Zetaproteobacteria bacterium]